MAGITSSDIGFTLKRMGLTPLMSDVNRFLVTYGGENYDVLAGRLPEVYIDKTVGLGLFEYDGQDSVLYGAMNLFNSLQRNMRVFKPFIPSDVLVFRTCLEPGAGDDLGRSLERHFDLFEEAQDSFGQACEVALERINREMEAELLSVDPSQLDISGPEPEEGLSY